MKPATPLPWNTKPNTHRVYGPKTADENGAYTPVLCSVYLRQNREYLVHACNLYPSLVVALDALCDIASAEWPDEDQMQVMAPDLYHALMCARILLAECEPDGYPSGTVDDVERYPKGKCEEEE